MRELFESAGVRGFVHARDIDAPDHGPQHRPAEVGLDPDEPVVLASVFKICVLLEYALQAAAGELSRTERLTVTAADKDGGIGTSGCADDVSLTLRDLAHFMMTMSDNAATDVIFDRIGQAGIDTVLDDLGLRRTRIAGCCADLFGSIADDLGMPRDVPDIDAVLAGQAEERLWRLSVLDPSRTTSSTPREMTALIDAIWSDRAAAPDACGRVRATMAQQLWPHRLRSGFPDGVRIAAKTGTLPAIRNEVGAVMYPDGRVYAVAVFTRADRLDDNLPDVDRAIGRAARVAIETLRGIG